MTQIELVQQKLLSIEDYRGELIKILDLPVLEILQDNIKVHAIERLFQLVVDFMVDINTHIIVDDGFRVPDDYQSTFEILATHGIFPGEFAYRIAPIVGMRNRVVHKYDSLDMKRFLEELKREQKDITEFIKYIKEYLKR